MDAKERLIRAIQHEESDYVPSFFKDVQSAFFVGNKNKRCYAVDIVQQNYQESIPELHRFADIKPDIDGDIRNR